MRTIMDTAGDLRTMRQAPDTQVERDVLTAFIHRELADWRVSAPDLPAEWQQNGPMTDDGMMPLVVFIGEAPDLADDLLGGPLIGEDQHVVRGRAWVREDDYGRAQVAWEIDASDYTPRPQSNIAGYGPVFYRPSKP